MGKWVLRVALKIIYLQAIRMITDTRGFQIAPYLNMPIQINTKKKSVLDKWKKYNPTSYPGKYKFLNQQIRKQASQRQSWWCGNVDSKKGNKDELNSNLKVLEVSWGRYFIKTLEWSSQVTYFDTRNSWLTSLKLR